MKTNDLKGVSAIACRGVGQEYTHPASDLQRFLGPRKAGLKDKLMAINSLYTLQRVALD
jgi:hypothetical protein